MQRHRKLLGSHPRLAIAYRQLDRMKPEVRIALSTNAKTLLANLDTI
jgi:deoxyribodipyrimidine photolyase-like uncharacterized protein